jgi:hypothetical protein
MLQSQDAPLSNLVPVISTALLPLAAFISLSIFLSTHPRSPARNLAKRRVALPIYSDEGLDGIAEEVKKDPFEIDDPVVRQDGTPVNPEKFWSSTWKRKAWLLASMLLPFGCNLAILVLTILRDYSSSDARTKAVLVPALILASHIPTLVLMYWHLSHNDTKSNWQTTIHLFINLLFQFLVIVILVLLPSTPPPRRHAEIQLLEALFAPWDVIRSSHLSSRHILSILLPIFQFVSLALAASIRRGPPIHLPIQAIYPPKTVGAIPQTHPALDPNVRNVSQLVETNILEWILFSYATPVIRMGATAESMDVWDVPILSSSLRESQDVVTIYGAGPLMLQAQ